MMAKVPDLGSDFSQKLLRDLRRRRERLGFESSGQHTSSTAPRDAYANAQKPIRGQKPLQGATRGGRADAATSRLYQQSSNAIVKVGGQHGRNTTKGLSHDIVPFGGGRGQRSASTVDVQMALALALSKSGKLQNIEFLTNRGSVFFGEPSTYRHRLPDRKEYSRNQYLLSPNAYVGNVAIGVQKLNDILAAYSSRARDFSKVGSVEIGKRLFKGAMELEESLSMLIMLQEASDYMVGSGDSKVLLLKHKEDADASSSDKGKANRKKPMHRSSARLVEIVDEDLKSEQSSGARGARRSSAKSSSNASLQLIAHRRSQSCSTSTDESNARGIDGAQKPAVRCQKDDANVRMPNVIAKLMGLEVLPPARPEAEHKGSEKLAKDEAKTGMAMSINGTGSKLLMQMIPSKSVVVKRQPDKLPASEEKTVIANSEESESIAATSNCSNPTTDRKGNSACVNYSKNERVIKKEVSSRHGETMQMGNHTIKAANEHKKPIDDSRMQKVSKESVAYRNIAASKKNSHKKDGKPAANRLLIEEKHDNLEKTQIVHEREINHAAHSKKEPAQDATNSEVKSRAREKKIAKENNHAITECRKVAETNGQTEHMRRQRVQQNATKKAPDYCEVRRRTARRNLPAKKTLRADPFSAKKKAVPPKPEANKPRDDTHDASESEDIQVSPPEAASTDHAPGQNTQPTANPTSPVSRSSEDWKGADQSTNLETNNDSIIHVATDAQQTPETFTGGGEQQPPLLEPREQPIEGLNMTWSSMTENQRFLLEALLKDQQLLDIAHNITGAQIRQDVNIVTAKEWSGKDTKILADITQEVMRSKGKRDEAIVSTGKTHNTRLKARSLGALIKELDEDIESLKVSKKSQYDHDNDAAECLQAVLHRDIQNRHPDANSPWDFGWNYLSRLPVETYGVVRDMERHVLNGIITEVARDLIEVSVCHA